MQNSLILIVALSVTACVTAAESTKPLPPDSEYVIPQGGDLYKDGKRIRFWGAIGGFPPGAAKGEDPYKYIPAFADRCEAYGFNMVRIWRYNRTLLAQGGTYKKGDGSRMDVYDKCIAEFKKRGFHLWMGAAGDNVSAECGPDDANIIGDAQTAGAWKAAIAKMTKHGDRKTAAVWDPRLEAILIRNNVKFLNHVNQHTGLRIGDDPVFAIWELNNEQWWIVHMVSGHWQRMPEFFQQSLLRRWHDYLKNKYGSDAKLRKAWTGLLEGESIDKGTVLLAPLRGPAPAAALNDANPLATAKFEGEPIKFGRSDFNYQRGADINEFFASLLLAHKARVAAAFKKGGKSVRLSSLLHDTGIGYNGIAQLLHQNADAVSHCAYIGGWTHDQSHKRFPWYSGLEEYPRICMGVPWLEHNTVEGKPYFVYETQIGAPAKYRAEFPYRVLFLAAINGWDAVCWHTLSGGYKWNSDEPLIGNLAFPGHAAFQFTYTYDETQLSAMSLAGRIFRGCSLEQAKKPTKFIYGRKTLYDPESMSYAGSYGKLGENMMHTTYRYGSRIEIDPSREDDAVEGPMVKLKGWAYPNPLKPTSQMAYNHNRGWLTFDTPDAAAFVGFLSQYNDPHTVTFEHGVTISDVTVKSPTDMRYPVTKDEMYVAIGVTSNDGKPLGETNSATISAVSTSHNDGLKVGPDPKFTGTPNHAWQGMKVIERGKTPIQFTRVGCVVTSKHLAGMSYRMRDWKWNVIKQGTIGSDGRLKVSEDDAVFLIELER